MLRIERVETIEVAGKDPIKVLRNLRMRLMNDPRMATCLTYVKLLPVSFPETVAATDNAVVLLGTYLIFDDEWRAMLCGTRLDEEHVSIGLSQIHSVTVKEVTT